MTEIEYSKVFIGNLNTDVATKMELDRIFSRYGQIRYIKLCKKFAFIAYTNSEDASRAMKGEKYRKIGGDTIYMNYAKRYSGTKRKRDTVDHTMQQIRYPVISESSYLQQPQVMLNEYNLLQPQPQVNSSMMQLPAYVSQLPTYPMIIDATADVTVYKSPLEKLLSKIQSLKQK